MNNLTNTKYYLYILIIALVIVGYPTLYYRSSETVTITIEDKERHTTSEDSYYLIYASDKVYKNDDSWLYLKFNSADYQRRLKVGETYKVEIAGWRVPFLSMYNNIIKIY